MHYNPYMTISELQSALKRKELSLPELLEQVQERAKACAKLNGFIEVFDTDSILALHRDNQESFLNGIPGAIKDNIAQKNRGLTCASAILKGFISPYDATVIERLKNAGTVLVGRTNMDEFAMGSSGETSAYGRSKNPWDETCVPGGSSSGSAIAVAAGVVPWALGTETGGSVRLPAALCGIVGLKPTYGRVSRYGIVAYGSSLDQVGIFTRTVQDNALVLEAMAGLDASDSTTRAIPVQKYSEVLQQPLKKGLRIGLVSQA